MEGLSLIVVATEMVEVDVTVETVPLILTVVT